MQTNNHTTVTAKGRATQQHAAIEETQVDATSIAKRLDDLEQKLERLTALVRHKVDPNYQG